MRPVILLVALVVIVQGCTGSAIRSKQRTVQFSERWLQPPKRLMYCGSDARLHHFTARPVDSFVFFEIDRSELAITDERPYTGDDLNFYYAVDPAGGFK